jgi:hypothetical protein
MQPNAPSCCNCRSQLPASPQGWVTASQESDAVRISASDGFDLTACVAPKPQPQNARPKTAAPALELKNPYRGLIKDDKVCWVRPNDSYINRFCFCFSYVPGCKCLHPCRQKRVCFSRSFYAAVRHARRESHRQAVRVLLRVFRAVSSRFRSTWRCLCLIHALIRSS